MADTLSTLGTHEAAPTGLEASCMGLEATKQRQNATEQLVATSLRCMSPIDGCVSHRLTPLALDGGSSCQLASERIEAIWALEALRREPHGKIF